MSAVLSLSALLTVVVFFFLSSAGSEPSFQAATVELSPGQLADTLVQELDPWRGEAGLIVRRCRLTNTLGTRLEVMSLGAAMTGLTLPDGADIVLGYSSLAHYQAEDNPYFGATVGRVANRIKGGRFSVGGAEYNVTVNNGPNTLHGGTSGWDKKNWKASVETDRVVFSYLSPDGDEGFPGSVLASVHYSLSEDNTVMVSVSAVSAGSSVHWRAGQDGGHQ